MPLYVFKCKDHGERELKLSYAEKKQVGTSVPCHACSGEALQVFTTALPVYNTHGFYGSVPTAEAHTVGMV